MPNDTKWTFTKCRAHGGLATLRRSQTSSNSAALYTIAQQFRLGNTFETIGD